jgi:hypothetical protein
MNEAANRGGLLGSQVERRISGIKFGYFRDEWIGPGPIARPANERRFAHLRRLRMRQRRHVTQRTSAFWAECFFQHQNIVSQIVKILDTWPRRPLKADQANHCFESGH